MTTRSLTFVYDESSQIICKLFLEFDGFPIGYNLANFLYKNKEIQNLSEILIYHFFVVHKDRVMLISPYEYNTYKAEWEYHIYKDQVEICDILNSKNYVSDWKSDNFTKLCIKLNV
jgi:hypothetical protein